MYDRVDDSFGLDIPVLDDVRVALELSDVNSVELGDEHAVGLRLVNADGD